MGYKKPGKWEPIRSFLNSHYFILWILTHVRHTHYPLLIFPAIQSPLSPSCLIPAVQRQADRRRGGRGTPHLQDQPAHLSPHMSPARPSPKSGMAAHVTRHLLPKSSPKVSVLGAGRWKTDQRYAILSSRFYLSLQPHLLLTTSNYHPFINFCQVPSAFPHYN